MSEGKPGEAVWHSPWMVYGKDGKPRFSPWRFVLIGAIITHGRKVPGMFEKATGWQVPSLSRYLATGLWFEPAVVLPARGRFEPRSELPGRGGTPSRRPSDDLCSQSRAHAVAGRYDEALSTADQAVHLDASSAQAFYARGIAHHYKQDYDRALADYSQAIELAPTLAEAYSKRGMLLEQRGDHERAISDLNQAVLLQPEDATAYNNLAWLWATCPDARFRDGKKAVVSATRSCELSYWKEANNLDTLAASYAEAGDFEAAARCQKKAIDLAPKNEATLKSFQHRLELYGDREPYREAPGAP